MLLKFVTYLLCAIHLIHCKKSDEDSSFTWQSNSVLPIEHSFGIDDQFTSRGQIAFRSYKGTTAYFTNEIELNENELEKLKNLAQQDGLYFIRSPIKIGGNLNTVDNETTRYVSTFVKACYLYGSRLTEKITIAIDFYGNVIGLSIISPRSDCLQEIHIPPHNAVFNSTVLIQSQVSFNIFLFLQILLFFQVANSYETLNLSSFLFKTNIDKLFLASTGPTLYFLSNAPFFILETL